MVMSDPRAEMPEDAKFVPPSEGLAHGYHGITPDTEDDHVYTVAGVIESDKAAEADKKAAPQPPASRTSKKEADK